MHSRWVANEKRNKSAELGTSINDAWNCCPSPINRLTVEVAYLTNKKWSEDWDVIWMKVKYKNLVRNSLEVAKWTCGDACRWVSNVPWNLFGLVLF